MQPTFSARTSWDLSPAPLAAALERHRAAGRPVLDLTVSNPTRAGLEFDAGVLADAFRHAGLSDYDPQPRGLPSARAAIAGYYRARGDELPSDAIHLTAGSSEAYGFLFMLLADPGDDVLVPRPSYPLIEYLAGLQGITQRHYHLRYGITDGWRIDEASLEAVRTPRTRAVIAVSPNNPTGSYLHPDDLRMLERYCAGNGLALIVDEVFHDFPLLEGVTRTSSAAHDGDALVFTINGFSKILGLPQHKLGWIVSRGPAAVLRDARARLDVIADAYLSVSCAAQLASLALWPHRETQQRRILERCRANLRTAQSMTEGCAPLQPLHVEGGWYLMLDIDAVHAGRAVRRFGGTRESGTGLRTDEALAIGLLEHAEVFVHPGYFFDVRSGVHLVLSLLTPPEAFRDGVSRMLSEFRD